MQDAVLGHVQIFKGRNRVVRHLFHWGQLAPSGTRCLCATSVPEPKRVSPSPVFLHCTDEELGGLWPKITHVGVTDRYWIFFLKIKGVGIYIFFNFGRIIRRS